jgi:alanine racemase
MEDIDLVIKNDITLTIISYDYYKELLKVNPKVKVHLKINSGMNRFGIKDKEQVLEIVNKLKKSNILLEGIFTHFATSGVSDSYYDRQISNFEDITSLINLKDIKIVHLFNSISTARHKKLPYANGIRFGLLMYGFDFKMSVGKLTKLHRMISYRNISPTMFTNDLNLKKVLSLHSEVININKLAPGEFVGYGARYIAHDNELIAVISIGHADGITPNYKNVIINDKKYPIVAICMDYIMVKVDNTIKVHDKVDLISDKLVIGRDITGDSTHHILVSITNRVPRKEVK